MCECFPNKLKSQRTNELFYSVHDIDSVLTTIMNPSVYRYIPLLSGYFREEDTFTPLVPPNSSYVLSSFINNQTRVHYQMNLENEVF